MHIRNTHAHFFTQTTLFEQNFYAKYPLEGKIFTQKDILWQFFHIEKAPHGRFSTPLEQMERRNSCFYKYRPRARVYIYFEKELFLRSCVRYLAAMHRLAFTSSAVRSRTNQPRVRLPNVSCLLW